MALMSFMRRNRWNGSDGLDSNSQLRYHSLAGSSLACTSSTNPGNIRRLCSAQQRIFEQCSAQPCALVLKVHGKSGQNHHRHGVLWNAFDHTRCRIGRLHTTNRQAVEANDRARMAAHVGLGTVGLLVDERKALQKLVQCALATVKGLNSVRTGQFANWLVSLRTQPSSPGSDNSFLSLGLEPTG